MHGSPPRPMKRWIATQLLLAAAGLVALADVGGGKDLVVCGIAHTDGPQRHRVYRETVRYPGRHQWRQLGIKPEDHAARRGWSK
jgi:hypothetical protein